MHNATEAKSLKSLTFLPLPLNYSLILRISTSGPPVDGGWSDWTWPDTCRPKSDTCKWKVTQTGRRECDRPQPAFGGRDCSGEETETRECYECDLGKKVEAVPHSIFLRPNFSTKLCSPISRHCLPSSKLLLTLPSRIYRVGGLVGLKFSSFSLYKDKTIFILICV